MTVGYMRGIATVSPFTYMTVLKRWRGSIWKGIVTEFFCWLFLYNTIALVYRIALFGSEYGTTFENTVNVVNGYLKAYGLTLNFVAAFYITYINTRWWWLFTQIPWPDNLCMLLSALMRSNGDNAREKERQIRLAICRYWNLSFVLLLRDISVAAKKRFPKLDDLKRLATTEELSLLRQADDMLSSGFQQTCLYSLPLDWIQKIIKQAADEGNFLKAHITTIHEEIVTTRQKMYNLLAQDFLCAIPISLTQVAIATPVTYFAMCLIGKQFLIFDPEVDTKTLNKHAVLLPIPLYTIYEFVIYIGWMKAAISMLNPFGMDDDDFEVDYLIDRNNNYTRVILDDLFEVVPIPEDVEFKNLPHTYESAQNAQNAHPMVGSVANVPMDQLDTPIDLKPTISPTSPSRQKLLLKNRSAFSPKHQYKLPLSKPTLADTILSSPAPQRKSKRNIQAPLNFISAASSQTQTKTQSSKKQYKLTLAMSGKKKPVKTIFLKTPSLLSSKLSSKSHLQSALTPTDVQLVTARSLQPKNTI